MSRDYKAIDINQVMIQGNLTRDPELKYVGNGTPVCEFSVAVGRTYKDKAGQRKEDTTFVNCVAWNQSAEFIGEHLKKGDPVNIQGSLKEDSWEDKATGQRRSKLKIQAFRVQPCAWKEEGSGGSHGAHSSGGGYQEKSKPRAIEEPIPEDDIPF